MTTSDRAIALKGHFPFRVCTATFDRGDPRTIIVGSFDGRISAYDAEGRLRWDCTVGGFPFALVAADLTGDGIESVLVGSSDMRVWAISSTGRVRWSYRTGGVVNNVAAGRLNGETMRVVVGGNDQWIHILSVDGQPVRRHPVPRSAKARVAVPTAEEGPGALRNLGFLRQPGTARELLICDSVEHIARMDLFALTGEALDEVWHVDHCPFEEPLPGAASGDRGRRRWSPHDLAIADLDGDGRDEIVLGSRDRAALALDDVVVLDDRGQIRAAARLHEPRLSRNDMIYRNLTPAIGRVPGVEGCAILALSGPRLAVLDADCRKVADAVAPVAFNAHAVLDGGSRVVLAVNADDSLRVVDLGPGWEERFAGLAFAGEGRRIRERTRTLVAGLESRPDKPPAPAGRVHTVEVAAVFMTRGKLADLDHYIRHQRWVAGQFPYANLRFATVLWLSEEGCTVSPAGREWTIDPRMDYAFTQDEIVGLASRLEREGIGFLIQNSHGCGGFLRLGTISLIIAAAPTQFLGLIGSETNDFDHLACFLGEYLVPEMEMLAAAGKHLVLREGSQFWPLVLADPVLSDLLFTPTSRRVLIPCAEEAVSRNGELHVACRAGLWLSGRVDAWGTRVIADQLHINPLWMWDTILCGHPFLRLLIAHASLGASLFMAHNGSDNGSGEPNFVPPEGPLAWTEVGREALVPFLHLLGQGILEPPRREDIAHLAGVAMALAPASARLRLDLAKGHDFTRFVPSRADQRFVISRVESWWAMADSFDTDAAYYLWGKRRHHGCLIPRTAFGFVPIIPDGGAPGSDVYATDGDRWFVGGVVLDPATGRDRILADLAAGAGRLPFRVVGDIFFQALRRGDRFRLVLVDPEFVQVADRRVTVTLRTGRFTMVRDLVSGASVGKAESSLDLLVPAGGFLLLEVALGELDKPVSASDMADERQGR